MAIQPGGEVWEDRRRLSAAVDSALALLAAGARASACETEGVDFKEEAGRRGVGGALLPGTRHNQAVAQQMADEVACLANSPGGGALVLGVADDGTVLGADTDRDWLRQRIHERVDVAPAVEERLLASGARLLVVLVAEAREPVEDTGNRLRWRVGTTCAPVDRSEWWAQRLRRQGADPLLAETSWTLTDLPAAALAAVRRLLRSVPGGTSGELAESSDRELLTRLGVLLPQGTLTAAGVHMLAAAPRTAMDLVVLDVPGGDVVNRGGDLAGLSLVEQLVDIETRLDALDNAVVLRAGLQLGTVRKIPWLAVREALLNAIVHRDWLPADPVQITWVQADSSLEVTSPGGFAGGVTSESVLSARYARNPALADLARALGLVERSGVGVDRMYREMVTLGHRPPLITEVPGPKVRVRLIGGEPLTAVVAVMGAVEPAIRQRDVRVALTLHALLRDGFAAPATLASLLQVPLDEAEEALVDVVAQCVVDGEPAIRRTSAGLWLPARALVERATRDVDALLMAQRRGLLTWWRPAPDSVRQLVERWLAVAGRISSGDLVEVTGFSAPYALKLLDQLASESVVRRGDAARGRRAHFVPVQPQSRTPPA